MSSHHFVREGQEPALILTDIFNLDDVGSLLEWSPFTIALPGALESVVLCGIHIDAAVGDSKETVLIERPDDYDRVNVPAHDLPSLLRAALNVLAQRNSRHVNIWAVDAARVLEIVRSADLTFGVSVVDASATWSRITTGKFSKWVPAGNSLRFYGASRPTVENLQLEGDTLTAVNNGLISIRASHPFWIGELRGINSHD
jgi:hypothetical protein